MAGTNLDMARKAGADIIDFEDPAEDIGNYSMVWGKTSSGYPVRVIQGGDVCRPRYAYDHISDRLIPVFREPDARYLVSGIRSGEVTLSIDLEDVRQTPLSEIIQVKANIYGYEF